MARFNTWKPEELTPEALAACSQRIRDKAQFILLVRKPYVFLEQDYFGLVENSFSMAIDENRAYVYFDAVETYNLTATQWIQRDMKTYQVRYPDWDFRIWAVTDPELPVELNWDLFLDGHAPSNDTLAGVKNKHEARNIRFYPRSQRPPRWWKQTTVQGLVPTVLETVFARPVSIRTGIAAGIAAAQLHDHSQSVHKIEP